MRYFHFYQIILEILRLNGGGGGIRTHERLAPLPIFKTGAFNRSATPPGLQMIRSDSAKYHERANPPSNASIV